jgi:PAS domain S-box-containing protein
METKENDILGNKIKEHMDELEKAYNLLMENEGRFSKAQKMAHIGIWDWNLVTNEKYWSDEMYHIYGCNPRELAPLYDVFLNYVHPDDRDYVDNATKGALKGQSYDIDFRIISSTGEEHVIHSMGEAIFDEKNIPIRIFGVILDITEHKNSFTRL